MTLYISLSYTSLSLATQVSSITGDFKRLVELLLGTFGTFTTVSLVINQPLTHQHFCPACFEISFLRKSKRLAVKVSGLLRSPEAQVDSREASLSSNLNIWHAGFGTQSDHFLGASLCFYRVAALRCHRGHQRQYSCPIR